MILIIANADDWSESGKEYERQEEYIKSQQASADVESSENNTNKGLFCNDIPMDTIMKMSVEDVIDAFGTPDEQSESHIAFYSEGILAEFDSQGFVEAWEEIQKNLK